MMATVAPPASDLERFVTLLWRPGDVREVRIPTPGRTDSGYFDSPAALVAAAKTVDGRENLYLTINPVNPALLSLAVNRLKSRVRTTTSDAQIVERRWLPIDIDPQRPSGISANESEREAALAVTRAVWVYLNDLGWPEPVTAMSGNGYWLLYPIELPNDAASKALVDGVLKHLAVRFSTTGVSIDTTVSNAARIVALIGTLKVKGDATADRPHRRSGLLRMPAELVPVPQERLAALAPPEDPVVIVPASGDRMPVGWVAKLLDDRGITYRVGVRGGITWYRLDRCPFHPDDDQGGDCGVGEDATGKAVSRCFHNRGSGKGWQDFKAALGLEGRTAAAPARQKTEPRPAKIVGEGIDAADLLALDLPPIRWIVPELIPEGTTILASPPKVGKSCFVYQVVVEAALGGSLLDRKVERGSALYLALEDGKRRGQARLRAALAGREMPRGFLEVRWDAHNIGEGLEEDVAAWLDGHPDAVLVAIDTLQKVRPQSSGKRGAYEVDVEDLGRLQTLFRDRRVALLIVHHARKDSTNDDFLASVSGTYGITGSADTIIVIRRKRIEAFGQIYVTGRDVEDAELSVRFDGLLWSSAPESLPESSFERTEVFRVIEAQGPIFPQAIADATGYSRQSVQNMATKLVDRGAVARTAGGYVVVPAVSLISDVSDVSDVSDTRDIGHAGIDVSDVSKTRANHASLISITDVSDVSDTRDIGDTTHARPREGPALTVVRDVVSSTVTCHFFNDHQTRHVRRADGSFFCPICQPEDAAS